MESALTGLLRPRLIVCAIGLAAAAAMIEGALGPWQVWEKGAPGVDSTAVSGMSYGAGWLVVGAAVIGSVGLLAFARGWGSAASVTVLVGLGTALWLLPQSRGITGNCLLCTRAETGWGYEVAVKASGLLAAVGVVALVVDGLERPAKRRTLES